MQSFPCPYCGPRDETEFLYQTDAGRTRPARGVSDADWSRYRFFRRNAKGAAAELWLHAAGCGRYIVIERDTLTHAVIASKGATP